MSKKQVDRDDEIASQIVRTIDVLIQFEIERKFAYFMDDPERIENAAKSLTETTTLLKDLFKKLTHPTLGENDE